MKLNLKHNIVRILLSLSLFVFAIISGADEPATQSAEALQAKADALGKQTFKRKNGQILSNEEIELLPQKVKREILNEMTQREFDDYYNWKDTRVSAIDARIAEKDKNIAKIEAEGVELDKQIVEKYILYIGNAEKLGKGSKRIFNKIINFQATPEARRIQN